MECFSFESTINPVLKPLYKNGLCLPDAVQIAEVELLPEAAAKFVTDPAGDG